MDQSKWLLATKPKMLRGWFLVLITYPMLYEWLFIQNINPFFLGGPFSQLSNQ
jgi:hypothetical protein